METLVWMGFLGVVGFMTLFWTAHKFYRKVKPAQRRENSPGLSWFAGIVAGVLTLVVLNMIANLLPSENVVTGVLQLVALVVAVWVGVRVYRLLRRRVTKKEPDNPRQPNVHRP